MPGRADRTQFVVAGDHRSQPSGVGAWTASVLQPSPHASANAPDGERATSTAAGIATTEASRTPASAGSGTSTAADAAFERRSQSYQAASGFFAWTT